MTENKRAAKLVDKNTDFDVIANLPEKEAQRLRSISRTYHYAAEESIFLQDSPAEKIYLVANGRAKIGGTALSFLSLDSQLLFLSQDVVLKIVSPILFFMTLSFAMGFLKDIAKEMQLKRPAGSVC